jgi:hypothetical protein
MVFKLDALICKDYAASMADKVLCVCYISEVIVTGEI